jgi:hypothetical protein
MADVDPKVEALFKRHLAIWKNALSRWIKKCKGVEEEHKERTLKRPLVADRRSPISGFTGHEVVSDATPLGYPSKTPADEVRDQLVQTHAENCKETLDRIRKTIEHLNNARTTGRFPSVANLEVSLRKQPKFITSIDRNHKIQRGEVVEVGQLKGDWMHVRVADAEGWIHKNDLMPKLPIETSSSGGGSKGTEIGPEGEIETGVRDTVGVF